MRKRKKKKNSPIKIIIAFLLLSSAIVVGYFALNKQAENDKEDEESKTLYNNLALEAITETDSELHINWEMFKGTDVVAWVKLGKYISYPVLQGEDNDYYLWRSYNGVGNRNGSIFMNCNNNKDLMDKNTIIYGHNMHYGTSMFSSFTDYDEYSKDNATEFYIYLPDGTKHTFDIYCFDKVYDLGFAYTTYFKTTNDFLAHKEELKSNSKYDFNIEPNNEKLVTLSTCTINSGAGERYVLVGQEREVKKVQKEASWYEKRNYIEVNNKKAICFKDEYYYYIMQDKLVIRCREEAVGQILIEDPSECTVRVEYKETDEVYEYEDLDGSIYKYPIVDVIDYTEGYVD